MAAVPWTPTTLPNCSDFPEGIDQRQSTSQPSHQQVQTSPPQPSSAMASALQLPPVPLPCHMQY